MTSDDSDNVTFMGIPKALHSVDDVLGTAAKLNLDNAIVLSEREDGSLVFLTTEMTAASANWLLDTFKMLLLQPEMHPRLRR